MGNLLNASVVFQLFEVGYYVDLNLLGKFVKLIVESVGLVGVGVIVFTLILKAITTPFEIYQRIKMRKQTLIMRSMQDDLDKLKKQYANDKAMYNQKMMELQKKNGYSLFGACLPMIVSFVILIIAVTAFQAYSQYANIAMYEEMSVAYNSAVLEYAPDGEDFTLETLESREPFTKDGIVYTFYFDGSTNRLRVESQKEDVYLFYTYSLDESKVKREYRIDVDKLYYNQTNTTVKSAVEAYITDGVDAEAACLKYFQNIGAAAAANWFRTENNPGFLWIKNVWYPDVSYNHPIQEYSSFTGNVSKKVQSENWEGERSVSDVISEGQYNILTAHLEEEKSQANGYFILIILTIGLMVLSQWLSMKSNKESNEYQSLEGSGARTQKIMLIVMPLIYAVTGFLWTAAFSIYISMSSIIGILVTLLSNLIIGRMFKKKEEEEVRNRYTRRLPWQKQSDDEKKKKK